MGKKSIKFFLYILGFVILAFIIINSDWRTILEHINSISLRALVLLLLLQCLTIILVNLQWKFMVSWTNNHASFLDVFMVNIKGNIVDAITPGVKVGGEFARIYELSNRLKIDLGHGTIIVGLQKTLSLISFLFLTLISLIWFNFTMDIQYRNDLHLFSMAIYIFSILFGILVLFLLKPSIIIGALNRLPSNSNIMIKIKGLFKDYSKILTRLLKNKKKFFYQLILGIFIWMLFAFKMLIVMRSFHVKIDYISVGAITFITYMVGMIPLLPGSIGSFESSMVLLLGIKGIPMEIGVSIAMVFRFVTFWFEFLISGLIIILNKVLVLYRKGDKNVGIGI